MSEKSSDWAKEVLSEPDQQSFVGIGFTTENRYRFRTFYHPYVCAFVRELNRNGLDGLLQRRVQTEPEQFALLKPSGQKVGPLDFKKEYEPDKVDHPIVVVPYPKEDVDFSEETTTDAAYALYNWELFFHAPLLIADRLSKNQRYEHAQKWFHYIFDPTDASSIEAPKRYWRTKPFFNRTQEGYDQERIQSILTLLAKGADPAAELSKDEEDRLTSLRKSVARWRDDPFKPHLIARTRTTAYQKTVVKKYLDNIIAWADQLFRRDTIESINEATQLYILAAEILGRRPEDVPPRASPRVQTYNSLSTKLDDFANALVEIEEFIAPSAAPAASGDPDQPPLAMLQFCIPQNDTLLGYWDTVADRLFKIRHCMNIEGIVRQLPLFEPPIEPGLLVKAVAAGVDISSVLNDLSAGPPIYRFNVLAAKVSELCGEIKSLGQAMLAALANRDGEQLALLRAQNETALLVLVEDVRKLQYDEAEQSKAALVASRALPVARYLHYQKLLGVQSPKAPEIGEPITDKVQPSPNAAIQEEGGIKMIAFESEEMSQLKKAREKNSDATDLEFNAGIAHIVPDINTAPIGIGPTFGGSNVGAAFSAYAAKARGAAATASSEAGQSANSAQFVLRAHDHLLQSNVAAREIMQIDQQHLAADLRSQIAASELSNHQKQLTKVREVEEVLKDKYTNQELYGWMIGELSTVYFQSYQLAYDLAKRAERAFRHELGLKDSSFIQFGYWDSLKKGLLAGERLSHDLKRMEAAYLEQNKREYEIAKHGSIAQLDPLALIRLRQTGTCIVHLPEALFDFDYCHYRRRIKSVSVSIPCVTGPYTGVNCTLTLLKSSVRHTNTLLGGKYGRQEGDPRFTDSLGAIQSVVISSGQNDSGLFETSLRDERFLPFEGAGVISEWQIELPAAFRQFDYDTISDVILHIRYTAREGGGLLRDGAVTELTALIEEGQAAGSVRLFSLRHEFPSEWAKFRNIQDVSEATPAELTLNFREEHYPFWSKGRLEAVKRLDVFAKTAQDSVEITYNADGSGTKNTLEIDTSLGGLLAGTLTMLPPKPTGKLTLYFNDNAMSDLWLAMTWGK